MKYPDYKNKILCGHTLEVTKQLPDETFDTIVTSPPYWGLRDYGVEGQIGLEPTLDLYLSHLWQITDELYRVLKKTGVMYWNHGDCYGGNNSRASQGGRAGFAGYKQREGVSKNTIIPKCLAMQNYRLILGMIDIDYRILVEWRVMGRPEGKLEDMLKHPRIQQILRNNIIWSKPNHMPSSVKDRFTSSYEPVFMLVKSKKYWFDLDAVRQPYTAPINRWGGEQSNGYAGKFSGHGQESEKYNSPRARTQRQQGESLERKRDLRPDPFGKNPGDVWTIPTQPFSEAHFATFPEKLIEPMILSSCPQWICKKCGKARVRIVETERHETRPGRETKYKDKVYPGQQRPEGLIKRVMSGNTTIGWSDCGCNAGWVAGITFDPFAGSGTTLKVAKKLGRNYSGIELNPDYKKMADKRLMAVPENLPFT